MEATTPEQEQFSLQIFIDELDPLIARLAETLAEAERITDSLRGEEEYDEEFHYAYEQSLEAASALIEARRFKDSCSRSRLTCPLRKTEQQPRCPTGSAPRQ